MNEAAKMIIAVADGFANALNAANPPPPRDRLAELQAKYLAGEITIVSYELQLEHMPGGIPDALP